MKRLFILGVISTLLIFSTACSKTETNAEPKGDAIKQINAESQNDTIESHDLKEKVSTDILEFTLNDSKLTISLDNTLGSGSTRGDFTPNPNFYTPVDYNPEESNENASKGHTFVYIDFTLTNTDRTDMRFSNFGDSWFTVEYNGETYKEYGKYYKEMVDGTWRGLSEVDILLQPTKSVKVRGRIDIPIDVSDLEDSFNIITNIPDSSGGTTPFSYKIG